MSGKFKLFESQRKQQKVDKKSCLYISKPIFYLKIPFPLGFNEKIWIFFQKNRTILQTFLLSCYPTDRQHLTALTLFDIVFIPAPKPSRKIGSLKRHLLELSWPIYRDKGLDHIFLGINQTTNGNNGNKNCLYEQAEWVEILWGFIILFLTNAENFSFLPRKQKRFIPKKIWA